MSKYNISKQFEITLKAIPVNDPLNNEHHACGDYFTKNNFIYWPLKLHADIVKVNRRLLNFFLKQKQAINVDINSFLKLLDVENALACLSGFLSADACFNQNYTLKTKKVPHIEHNFIIDTAKYQQSLKTAEVLIEAEKFAAELIAMPSNYLDGDRFEQILLTKFNALKGKVKINILHKADLQRKKMGLILAVGQASPKVNEPRIITIDYHSDRSRNKKLALVGKGIMFDTGGLNLKPGDHMKEMHMDMSGAAITFGTIYALAKLNVPANVVGIGAIATNDINNNAFRTTDVITSYSGKTVEILNTDAEGRLVLADAITYANRDLKADTIMTIATLTGAIDVALGNVYSGIWISNDAQHKMVFDAAKAAGEPIWRMPFHFEYLWSIENTPMADVKNIGERAAGSCTAAEFLKYFAFNSNFIHADIASTHVFKDYSRAVLLRTMYFLAKDFK